MMNNLQQSMMDKEMTVIGTLLYCNDVISSLNRDKSFSAITNSKSRLFESCDVFRFSLMNIASQSTGMELKNLNESMNEFLEKYNIVSLEARKNYYAYFQKVMQFLNGYELDIQHSLNESMMHIKSLSELDVKQSPNKQRLGGGKASEFRHNNGVVTPSNYAANITPLSSISSFKNELKKYIAELETINDFDKYDNKILKIKILSNRPLFVYGMNITNSLVFQKTMSQLFGVVNSNLLAIYFNKNIKTIVFIYQQNFVIQYSIKNDDFEKVKVPIEYSVDNYEKAVKEYFTYNMLVLYENPLMLKFNDNLYNDVNRKKYAEQQFNLRQQINKF